MPERISAAEFRAIVASPKRSKYGNRIVKVGDLTFHSKAEAERWQHLQMLEKVAAIENLQRQVPIPLRLGTTTLMSLRGRAICLIADFTYEVGAHLVVEDVKGFITKEAALKAAIARAMGLDLRFMVKRGQLWEQVQPTASRRRHGQNYAGKTSARKRSSA